MVGPEPVCRCYTSLKIETHFGIMSFVGNLKQPISTVISKALVFKYCQSCMPPARWYHPAPLVIPLMKVSPS